MPLTQNVNCTRCGKTVPAQNTPPFPTELGAEIQSKTCSDCWHEWQEQEVRVINELRLNFMDPKSEEILQQQLREFLVLGSA